MPIGLDQLSDDALETIRRVLNLKDLASLSATSTGMRAIVGRQPEAVWKAAAAQDASFPRWLRSYSYSKALCIPDADFTYAAAGTHCMPPAAS